MKRYIPYDVKFDSKVVGDKETIRVQGVMLEHPEGPYVNFTDAEHLITERDAAVKAERERCAKICDKYAKANEESDIMAAAFDHCAAAIRGEEE